MKSLIVIALLTFLQVEGKIIVEGKTVNNNGEIYELPSDSRAVQKKNLPKKISEPKDSYMGATPTVNPNRVQEEKSEENEAPKKNSETVKILRDSQGNKIRLTEDSWEYVEASPEKLDIDSKVHLKIKTMSGKQGKDKENRKFKGTLTNRYGKNLEYISYNVLFNTDKGFKLVDKFEFTNLKKNEVRSFTKIIRVGDIKGRDYKLKLSKYKIVK